MKVCGTQYVPCFVFFADRPMQRMKSRVIHAASPQETRTARLQEQSDRLNGELLGVLQTINELHASLEEEDRGQ